MQSNFVHAIKYLYTFEIGHLKAVKFFIWMRMQVIGGEYIRDYENLLSLQRRAVTAWNKRIAQNTTP